MHQTKACDSCGASLIFLKTATGKWMPVDAETVSPDDAQYEPRSGHVSHWETCDDPARFRREGRGGGRA